MKKMDFDTFKKEMDVYALKLNEIVLDSNNGKVPQIFKALLFKELAIAWLSIFEIKENAMFKEAKAFFDKYAEENLAFGIKTEAKK